jgi:hypothetical protein
MQAGEGLLSSTSMEACIQTALGTTEEFMVFCLMSPTIFGITLLRDLLMLRYGSSRDGGTCKLMSLRRGSNRWLLREDSNLSTEVGLQAMRHAQFTKT